MANGTEIAKTILAQIDAAAEGGSLLAAVTKRDFVSFEADQNHAGGVQFSLKKGGSKKLNKMVVKLAFDDTYTVEFHTYDRKTWEGAKVKELDGVYCDTLAHVLLDFIEA